MNRESFIRDQLQAIGIDSFPDDVNVRWHFHSAWHEGDYSLVEAEPQPATVGYPRFRFVLEFDAAGKGVIAGCYALMEGQWSLLFTAPERGSQWQGMFKTVK